MSPEEKERLRWQFAGQIMAALIVDDDVAEFALSMKKSLAETVTKGAVEYADALIAELEATAPVATAPKPKPRAECEHEQWVGRTDHHGSWVYSECLKCGVKK